MEKINNVNLQPLTSVIKWDTKRIVNYKNRIQKHISFLESGKLYGDLKPEDIVIQKFKNYKDELKKILEKREHVE